MPQFLIERVVPGAAGLTQTQLRDISQKSCCAMEHMGPNYKWHHTYVAGDRFYCIHEAPSEEVIREHSRRGGFPVTSITEIAATISPKTAEHAPAVSSAD